MQYQNCADNYSVIVIVGTLIRRSIEQEDPHLVSGNTYHPPPKRTLWGCGGYSCIGKVFEPPPVKLDVTTTTDKPFNLKKVLL